MSTEFKIAIFASGSGTNAEEIMNHFREHARASVVLLLSNNAEAFALKRAEKFGVATKVFTRQLYKESEVVLEWLREKEVTHVVLAGFLWLVPAYLTNAFPDHIINIHPSLLPKFGGKGMYGMKVHEAVKTEGEKTTGITIHLVNEHYDEGRIIFQASCEVSASDSPETIASKVHALEYAHFPQVIDRWITGKA
ncbi:phosphoribosylglycinamide formyltransferase [Chryseolinea lacunae]